MAGPNAERPALLRDELANAWAQGLNIAAVLDPASLPQAWPKFGTLAQARGGGSLFEGTQYVHDTSAAPMLLPLQRDDAPNHTALVNIAMQTPAVIWMATPLDMAQLAKLLTSKLHAVLADGHQPITLRYYDPRVLPALLQVLDSDQRHRLSDGIHTWWWFDRRNILQRHTPASMQTKPLPSPLPPTAMTLTDPQVQALLHASFDDRVLDVLHRTAPDCLTGLQRAERHALAERSIQDAGTFGIESEYDCAIYIAVVLQHGQAFATQSDWEPLMSQVSAGTLTFSDAVAAWEERHAKRP